jgi:hypothetical protein
VPPGVFLRETPRTAPEGIRGFADAIAAAAGSNPSTSAMADARHPQSDALDVNATDSGTSAIRLRHREGVCQTSPTSSAPRHLGPLPAGYLFQPGWSAPVQGGERPVGGGAGAGHAAEALVPSLGWVGFDPANGVSPTDAYVRVAVGLDYLGAAPVRGTRYGGSGESLSVKVVVQDATRGGR